MKRIGASVVSAGVLVLIVVGCGPDPDTEPVQTEPRPMLAAARDPEITLFGELPLRGETPYVSATATALRQHTFAEEGADFDPDVDGMGQRLVFASTRHSENPNLYVKNLDGVAVTQLTSGPASDVEPTFSPDGRFVAFASDRAGNWDIWIVGLDGQQPVQVTQGPAHEVSPSWSPDGKSLVYCRLSANGGQWELWVTDAAAGGTGKFIGYGLFPEWSPAGDTILYQRARQRGSRWFSIWTLELIQGEPRYPTEIASSAAHAMILPAWSAEGAQVAYCAVTAATTPVKVGGTSAVSDQADIWVVSADGTGRTRLTNGMGACFSPTWSSDGRIHCTRRWGGRENIWSLLPVVQHPWMVQPATTLSQGAGRGGGQATGLASEGS
jgi:TolB protein